MRAPEGVGLLHLAWARAVTCPISPCHTAELAGEEGEGVAGVTGRE